MDTTTQPPLGRHGTAQADADHIGNMGRYLYQIRNMMAWLLVFWLVSVAAAVGVGIYLGHQSAQQAASNSQGYCQQGSLIQSC